MCPALPDSDTGGRVSRAPGRPLTGLWLTPVRKGTGLPDDVRFPSALTFYSEFRALVKSNFNKRIIWKILCGTSINRLYFLLLTTKGQMPIMQQRKTRSSKENASSSQTELSEYANGLPERTRVGYTQESRKVQPCNGQPETVQ